MLKYDTSSYCKISSEQVFYFRFSHRASGRPPQRLYTALTAADGSSKYSGKVAAADETALNEPSWLSHGLCGTSLSRNFCIDDGISRKSHPPSQGRCTIFGVVCLIGFCHNNNHNDKNRRQFQKYNLAIASDYNAGLDILYFPFSLNESHYHIILTQPLPQQFLNTSFRSHYKANNSTYKVCIPYNS